jgi:hypothetical protein
MNTSPPTRWLDKLMAATMTLVLVAVGLSWAWRLLRPLVPVLVAVCCIAAVWYLLVAIHKRNGW